MQRAKEIYVPLGGKWNDSKRQCDFPHLGGNPIRFRYIDRDTDAMHYQGRNLTYVGVDEMGQFATPKAIDMLWGALRSAHGVPTLFRATGNPGGPGHMWIKERYIDPADPMTVQQVPLPSGAFHQRVFIPSFITDNEKLLNGDPGYVDRLHLVGAKWLVQAWLRGDWNARPTGHFFDTLSIQYGTPPKMNRIYLGVDLATKDKDSPDREWKDRDFTAMAVIGVDHLNRFWLLDMFRDRIDTSKAIRKMIELHRRWKFTSVYMEGGPIWSAVEPWALMVQRSSGVYLPIDPCQPSSTGDKAIRATPLQTLVNAGGLWIPSDGTPWLNDFLTEMSIFQPTLARKDEIHDDQVDAVAWVAYRLLELIASKDPTGLEARGMGPIGKMKVSQGELDGRAAEEILKRMEVMRRGKEDLYDPAAF